MNITDIATVVLAVLGIPFMAVLAVVPILLGRDAERTETAAPVVTLRPERPAARLRTTPHAA